MGTFPSVANKVDNLRLVLHTIVQARVIRIIRVIVLRIGIVERNVLNDDFSFISLCLSDLMYLMNLDKDT